MNTENTDIKAEDNKDKKLQDDSNTVENSAEHEPPKSPEKPEPPKPPVPPKPAVRPEPPKKQEKAPRKGGALAFLAFLFSIAALAGTGWMWWQDQSSAGQEETRIFTEISRLESTDSEQSLKLKQLRDQMDTLASGDVSAEFRELQARLQADRAQMDSVEKTMREQLALSRSLQSATESIQGRLQAAEAAVTNMSTRELDADGELDLAEVDYLLRLANERVKLFSDPVAADQALEVADMHLAALDNPMYLGVRQDIATARRELAAVETPDFLAIAGQLDEIQQAIPALAFLGENVVVHETAAVEGEGWWEKIKSAFSGLVTVRQATEDKNERISIEDKDYIRQRVWLQLEISHLALMRRDQQAFRSSLERSRETLAAWFEPETDAFQQVMAGLDSLGATEIQVDVPDITAPWSTLRLLRRPGAASAPLNDMPPAAEDTTDNVLTEEEQE